MLARGSERGREGEVAFAIPSQKEGTVLYLPPRLPPIPGYDPSCQLPQSDPPPVLCALVLFLRDGNKLPRPPLYLRSVRFSLV